MIKRSVRAFITAMTLSFCCCETYPEGDGQYCVTCWKEWDEDVNWVYNLMPTKLCESELDDLLKSMDEFTEKGYTCGDIREP